MGLRSRSLSAVVAADVLRPVVRAVLGTDASPVEIQLWDGSTIGGPAADTGEVATKVLIRSPNALRRLLYSPNELGFGRAFVAGELDVEGDIFAALGLRDALAARNDGLDLRLDMKGRWAVARAAAALGVLGRPLPAPAEEVRLRGRRHSPGRDAAAIAHHYNVGNDFYRLVLGPTLAYSCAYFERDEMSLDEAQQAKFDLVARKLGLRPGMRVLDVGCGWGGMVIHAAALYDVDVVGITLSTEQAELARKRVAEAGLTEKIEIRVQDYRDVDDGPFDAISSIGMFEHVGIDRLSEYVRRLASLLVPRGRLLNHGISRLPGPSAFDKHSFIERYVFPDGELHEVGRVVSLLQEHGLEVRDVHSLREHYARTLRQWVANLESSWSEAVDFAGEARARVWRLYMAGSARNFEENRTSIHQILAVKPDGAGYAAMPRQRVV